MYHLGNPGLKDSTGHRFFFAYDLLRPACRQRHPALFLEFDPRFEAAVRDLLQLLIQASPEKRLVFTTDWQFGPRRLTRGGELTVSEFWQWHAKRSLRLNGCYTIIENNRPASEAAGVNGRRRNDRCQKRRAAAAVCMG